MRMTATFASLDVSRIVRGNRSVCRRYIDPRIAARSRTNEDEIAQYIERHRHDLPPELRIALERRQMGQYGD